MAQHRFLSVLLAALVVPGALFAADTLPVYRDPSKPQAARIDDLISRMTLEEKASMMQNTTPGVPRLGIPKYDWWSEALHGVANAGQATVFPQAIGLAAMWDAPLQQEIAGVAGVEGRAKFNGYVGTDAEGTIFHGLTFWSPNVNIFRDPRWGRGQETYGEDPYLTSRLGVAFVKGLQGDNPDYLQAAACAKHFAVHSGPESLRHNFNVNPSAADLHETYLPAFEALVRESRVEVVMTAYNAIDGIPCSVNPMLYQSLKDWGFNGHVTSDCGSVADLSHTYRFAADAAEAEAMTLKAGMNVCCGGEATAMPEAVKRGILKESEIDGQLHPLLRTMFRLGFFDPKDKVPFNAIPPSANDTPEHEALALKAARESIVLLKNDGILPIDAAKIRRVAIVGPNATSVPALTGNYCGEPARPVTVLAGLRKELEARGIAVDYAYGCDYSTRPTTWRAIPQPWFRGEYFASGDLSGKPVEKRTERPLCYECGGKPWEQLALPQGLPEKGVSARWNGELQTTIAGDYRLRIRARGGFRLFVDGKQTIDAWKPAAGEECTVRTVEITCSFPETSSIPVRVEYTQGDGPVSIAFEWIAPAADTHIEEAVALAKKADLIVFVGGLTAQLEGEEMKVDYDGFSGGDRDRIELPALQERFLKELAATGKPVVMVNMSGSAVALPWEDAHLGAIVQAWYPGEQGGAAVADILTGACNPSGRLPVTFYRATEDLPDFKDYSMTGRTYRYFAGKALYPFGHGLSYTKFDYSNLHVARAGDGSLKVSVNVRNAGGRDGDEVVQIYAVPPKEAHPREREALCGFSRVHLAKGEVKTVEIAVPSSALRRWNDASNAYWIPSGDWAIRAGASSEDIRLVTDVGL
jgi:beta-glucosidase